MLKDEALESVAGLMDRLRPFVKQRVRSPADVDDVLQDVFVRMQHGLPRLRDLDRFDAWIYRIVRNAITDRYRAQARETELPGDTPAGGDDDRSHITEGLTACLAPFIARLPTPYREAVSLVDLEGVTHKQAAEMLRISVPGMKSRVQRGRARLREMFEECCEIELDVRSRIIDYRRRTGRAGGDCGSS